MADKNFKVKSGLNIPIASAAILTTDANGNISSTATLPISAGGTGQTSATNAINALLPVQNGSTVNYAIQSDGTNINWGKLYNQTIKNNGTTVTPRGIVNIVGATFADDSGTDTTTITFTDTTGVSTSGGSTITAASASTKGLVIQGADSQTANLQEWQNSAGTVKAFVRYDGFIRADASLQTPTIYGPSVTNGTQANIATAWTFATNVATNTGIIVKGAASQTADLQQWQNSSGTVLAGITQTGNGRFSYLSGQSGVLQSLTGLLASTNLTNRVNLTVQAIASQTANLQEWQNSSGTVLSKITNSGGIYVEGGGAASQINGTFGQLSIRAGGTTPASATIGTGYGAGIGLVIFGAASQSANLQEWWNNVSGTILAKVDSSGSMFTTTAAAGTNTTQVATTAFVKTAIDNLIASAPGTLDTLDEIAQALNDDPNFYTTITTLTNALAEQDSYTLMGVF